jgi:ABC-type dipeptide/oligopeptide/nickel transport system permease component
MFAFILRRLLISIPTLIGAFALIFVLTRFVPGDPVLMIMEQHAGAGDYDAIERQLGLDVPIWEQFVNSFVNTVQGDLGTSFNNRRPVTTNIGVQLVPTIQLALASMIVAGAIGIPLGVVAAMHRNRFPDFLAMVTALLALCAPSFWLGILLILLFSLKLQLLPTFGIGDLSSPTSTIQHLILPAVTLGAAGAGLIARVTRSSMLEVLSDDYIRTARAKGLSERNVVYRHGLRNAMIPVTTIFGIEAVTLLTGVTIVETVFARRGLGRLLIESVITRDYPQLQGILLLFVVMAVVISLLVDIIYGLVDPRVRYQ